MLYYPEYNTAFIHVPKCGGFWVTEVTRRHGWLVRDIPDPRDPKNSDRHLNLQQADICEPVEKAFSFIRHPADWLASFWMVSLGRPHSWDSWDWHVTYPLQKCRHMDFGEFIERVLDLEPGIVGRIYDHYLNVPDGVELHVGQLESMEKDFLRISGAVGLHADRTITHRSPIQNRTTGRLGPAVWRPGLREEVEEVECNALERWREAEAQEEECK